MVMKIDITILAGFAVSIITILTAVYRFKKSDNVEIKERTNVSVNLEYIRKGVDDIRIDLKAQDTKIGTLAERVAKVEENIKIVHHRLDEVERETKERK